MFVLVAPFLFYQAQVRLQTLSCNRALWSDAAAKLPATPVPWGWRPLTNLAREQTHARRIDQAIKTIERCLNQYPNASRCYFARGAISNYMGQHEQALPYLDRAIAIFPELAVAHYQRGVALEGLGRPTEADAAYQESTRRGYFSTRKKRR
jgi:tetratricopeptide (TPR) repeat protein